MAMTKRISLMLILILVALPAVVLGITEKKTGTEYPDQITVTCGDQEVTLDVTGAGLREKTFLKVDVYTIVSYTAGLTGLGLHDQGVALCQLQQPKRLQMDLRRGFSREKLIHAFVEVIEKNYSDRSAFATDMMTFEGYFTRDAQDKDKIVFDYCPGVGLTTTLNGEKKGLIDNPAFAEALWSVWFGQKPANKNLKRDLLTSLATE